MTRLEMLKRLLIDNNKLLAKEQEVICPKGASVALWALLRVRLNRVFPRTLIKEWLEVGYNFAA